MAEDTTQAAQGGMAAQVFGDRLWGRIRWCATLFPGPTSTVAKLPLHWVAQRYSTPRMPKRLSSWILALPQQAAKALRQGEGGRELQFQHRLLAWERDAHTLSSAKHSAVKSVATLKYITSHV